MRKLNIRGDTIIEVLLALTVVSSLLGGAYLLSNRSLNNNRESQERGEALKNAESQVEKLKSHVNVGDKTPFNKAEIFCIDSTNSIATANTQSINHGSIPPLGSDDFSKYTSNCTINNLGVPYYASIERSSSNVFTIRMRWDRLGAAEQNEVRLIYRVYQ